MSTKYLHREDAPFGSDVWKAVDHVVSEAAKSQLSGRRLLHIEGPYGLGLKSLPGADRAVDSPVEGAGLVASAAAPVALIQKPFSLSARDIAAAEQTGLPLPLAPAAEAALACARLEDELIFNGSKPLGADGLLNASGTLSAKLKAWTEVGAAVEDIIGAATKLDEAGFHGPYALALGPARFNKLFRRYAQGNATELEHVRQVVTEGIVKAPAVGNGGLLLASGRQYATIVVGQDLSTGFVGPADGGYDFVLSESVALRLLQPAAVCVLK
jgi:uncharacterized linocin/CFP29 family protein